VAVSFLCTSLILAIQYVADVSTSFRVGRWLVGGLEVVGFAPVLHVIPFDSEFELQMSQADADWLGTRVRFRLADSNGKTRVCFAHIGWPQPNDHYRTSSFCWAMYLRILRRYREDGEIVPDESRLNA
jgi:hypothetical protein